MVHKIPYTQFYGKHRPYLEVLFFNKSILKESSKTFGLIDSGADHNVIPFSLGIALGFQEPKNDEFQDAGGVGGNISLIRRDCVIYIVSQKDKVMYGFNEEVYWAYPNLSVQVQLKKLREEYTNMLSLQRDTIPATSLHQYFKGLIDAKVSEINTITDKFEPGVLLGRPFFNNFDFIQFFHKDKTQEDRCFFNFPISQTKIVDTKKIE